METQGERVSTRRLGGTERMVALELGNKKYGEAEYDLLLRCLSMLDKMRVDALRQQYIEILGIVRMSTVEQDRKLMENKAYQKALVEAQSATDRDKRLLREIFDRSVAARELRARLELRRARLQRMRDAIRARLQEKSTEYETKKRLYEHRFDQVEQQAYQTGSARIEDDRKRYETLSGELQAKLREENESIARAQKALENAEKSRESLDSAMVDSRKAVESAIDTLRKALEKLTPSRVEGLAPPEDGPGQS